MDNKKSSGNKEGYSLDKFVANLNAQAKNEHATPIFCLVRDPGTSLLLGIEVRFSASAYRWRDIKSIWQELTYRVGVNSHRGLIVASSPEMLQYGILEMKAASRNHNFREDFVAKTIEWLVNKFFPMSAKY